MCTRTEPHAELWSALVTLGAAASCLTMLFWLSGGPCSLLGLRLGELGGLLGTLALHLQSRWDIYMHTWEFAGDQIFVDMDNSRHGCPVLWIQALSLPHNQALTTGTGENGRCRAGASAGY